MDELGVVTVLVEVGFRFNADRVLCEGVEQCKRENPTMTPGVIYEVEAHYKDGLASTPEAVERIYKAIMSLRRQYPGVIINYIGISDDGKTITIQIFDLGGWQLIIVLALILAIIYAAKELIGMIIRFLETTAKPVIEEIAGSPLLWIIVIASSVAVAAAAVGYAAEKIKK